MGNSNPPRDIDAARGVDSVRMRRWTWVVMAVLLAVGAAAHVRYWYLPRERSASPAAGSAAAVWSGAPLPLRVWIPYPHQNLAVLRRAAPAGLGSLLRLFGVKIPELPRFGPFDVPPSAAVAVASDSRGEHFVALAEVYPAIALIARAAGRVADNPWLRGGEVRDGERRLRIGWHPGNVWWVTTEDPDAVDLMLESAAPLDALPPGLAWFRSERPLSLLPAGDYRLEAPVSSPKLIYRDPRGQETTVLDLGGDGTHLDIRLPAQVPAE
jgi:hypothetical protein